MVTFHVLILIKSELQANTADAVVDTTPSVSYPATAHMNYEP
jgi:hypothetical protein